MLFGIIRRAYRHGLLLLLEFLHATTLVSHGQVMSSTVRNVETMHLEMQTNTSLILTLYSPLFVVHCVTGLSNSWRFT